MNRQKLEELPPPPGVMGSLRAGFDAVSSHVWLILLPLLLDIFLWLGPRWGVDGLVNPIFKIMFEQARLTLTSTADLERFTDYQSAFSVVMERFNLLSLLGKLQTFPIGVSSLLAQTMPVETPFGSQNVMQVSSLPGLMGMAFLLVVIGWIAGGLYFRWVSGIALGDAEREAKISFSWAIIQTVILSVLWFIGLMVVLIPLMFILTILTLLSPVVASGALLVILIFSFWLIVPLFFTPHGIFVRRQNAFYSIFTSLRMARFTLPTSGLFVLCVLLLSTGLNYLWSVPPDDSWMLLVGLAGHAFIRTALLAASFVYYRDMNVWLQTVFEKLKQKQSVPAQRM
ncbi:MAG TPA: hypothetical protein VMN99_03440 [Anaerolineales bacterium]|nr:hypothetical protein [Anaerolineales bacterium]